MLHLFLRNYFYALKNRPATKKGANVRRVDTTETVATMTHTNQLSKRFPNQLRCHRFPLATHFCFHFTLLFLFSFEFHSKTWHNKYFVFIYIFNLHLILINFVGAFIFSHVSIRVSRFCPFPTGQPCATLQMAMMFISIFRFRLNFNMRTNSAAIYRTII